MRIVHVEDKAALSEAAASLRAGQLVVVPTDTVYGLAVLPGNAAGLRRLYLAKDRPEQLQVPVLAASLDQVRQLGVELSEAATALAARWWPGPLTMALGFAAAGRRPPWLDDRDEVAVRVPQHAFLLSLLVSTGVLLVTSANRHGAPTAVSAIEAAESLAPHVHLAIDGGPLDETPSTLVNVHSRAATVEREGAIPRAAIVAALAGLVEP